VKVVDCVPARLESPVKIADSIDSKEASLVNVDASVDIKLASPVKVDSKPVLDGREIMDILGIKPGPKVGEIGKWLLEKTDEYAERGIELTKQEAERLLLEEM